MQNIGLDLERAHAAAVDIDLRDEIGVLGLLNPNQVATSRNMWFPLMSLVARWGGLPASSYPVTWCEGCDGNKK